MTEPSPLGLPEEPHRDLPADYQRALVEPVVDVDVVTELVRRNLECDFLEAERCSVFLYDERTGELFTKVASGLDAEIRFPANQGIAGAVFASGQPLLGARG